MPRTEGKKKVQIQPPRNVSSLTKKIIAFFLKILLSASSVKRVANTAYCYLRIQGRIYGAEVYRRFSVENGVSYLFYSLLSHIVIVDLFEKGFENVH